MARAFGSYPKCRRFESYFRYQRPGGQAVKTPPFHGGNTSSILVRVTIAPLTFVRGVIHILRRCGGIGRHKGLKIPRSKIRTGSSPVSGINQGTSFYSCFFYTTKKTAGNIHWIFPAVLVPATGLEPVRGLFRGILSPLCLPIPPRRQIGESEKAVLRQPFSGDPDGNRTRVTAVKGRCLNRLTTGPFGSGNRT